MNTEELSLSRYSSMDPQKDYSVDEKGSPLIKRKTEFRLIEEKKPTNKKSYIRRNAILRLCSISTARVFLIIPYVIYLCGMGNFILWYILVGVLSLVKTAALVRF